MANLTDDEILDNFHNWLLALKKKLEPIEHSVDLSDDQILDDFHKLLVGIKKRLEPIEGRSL